MEPQIAIDEALGSEEPTRALRSIAQELVLQGHSRSAILGIFENARLRLGQQDREAEEDALLDTMDFVAGWCSPHMKLPPEPGPESQQEDTGDLGAAGAVKTGGP